MTFKDYADIAQNSLYHFFKSDEEGQFLNNFYPIDSELDNEIFNYWWLSHTVDARLDGYIRTNENRYLEMARETYNYLRKRNGNTLIHDFYDDMLWNGLACVRFYQITKEDIFLQDAIMVWQDIVDTAWNDVCDGGFAWRRQQPYYKNTPVNGPFIILSAKLYHVSGEEKYLEWALKTYEWLTKTLVNPENGFVEDGINRSNDGKIDYEWKFTYNQGVYIGASVELYHITHEKKYLLNANKSACIALETLTQDGVFRDEGDGGDEGLFKGIFYRYFKDLIEITNDDMYKEFVKESCKILCENCIDNEYLLASKNWRLKSIDKTALSTQLSAIMALEVAVAL